MQLDIRSMPTKCSSTALTPVFRLTGTESHYVTAEHSAPPPLHQPQQGQNSNRQMRNLKSGEWHAVKYDNAVYPGRLITVAHDDSQIEVNAMKSIGENRFVAVMSSVCCRPRQ